METLNDYIDTDDLIEQLRQLPTDTTHIRIIGKNYFDVEGNIKVAKFIHNTFDQLTRFDINIDSYKVRDILKGFPPFENLKSLRLYSHYFKWRSSIVDEIGEVKFEGSSTFHPVYMQVHLPIVEIQKYLDDPSNYKRRYKTVSRRRQRR